VGNQSATSPASRGRIIKKGGVRPSERRPVPVAPTNQPGKKSAVAPLSTGFYGRLREHMLTYVAIPLVFAASAGFMWSRPLDTAGSGESTEPPMVHARFHQIGNEIAGKFSGKVNGVVVQPAKSSRVLSPPPPPIKRISARAASVPPPAPPKNGEELAALEGQVFRVLKRHGKPVQNGKDLAAAIVREAVAQEYDPVFVAAVIKSESAFNSLARSHKGAQGLMQIMPKTGAWLADQQSIPRGKLTDPGHNLKLGISYLKQLEQEYGGNRVLTLIAYNWGPGHLASASSGGRRVPGEVMQYAVKILNDYRRWSNEMRSSVG